jgi:hypothetical protein
VKENPVTRDEALQQIRAIFPALRDAYGLRSLAVFGSVARNEAGPGSDIDLLVEFEAGKTCGYFGFFRLQQELESELGVRVDLVTPDALKAQLKDRILTEAIHAA